MSFGVSFCLNLISFARPIHAPMSSSSLEASNQGHKAPHHLTTSIHHTPDGETLASEAGNAASGASITIPASQLSAPASSHNEPADHKPTFWFDGMLNSIRKPKQPESEPPPPPPYSPPEVETTPTAWRRSKVAVGVDGTQEGSPFSEAPYEEYEPEAEDGKGAAAEAATLEVLTLRIVVVVRLQNNVIWSVLQEI